MRIAEGTAIYLAAETSKERTILNASLLFLPGYKRKFTEGSVLVNVL